MFPLSVITWKLGDLSSNEFEKLIPDDEKEYLFLKVINDLVNGIYFLKTCQRIIITIPTDQDLILENIIEIYHDMIIRPNSENNSIMISPETIVGISGLSHLANVISGLESLVIGEYEIQHQFKLAFENSKPFLGDHLKNIIPQIIRIGKRVRNLVNLNSHSTIEAAHTIYNREFMLSKNIAVIGTGRMGRLILEYLSDYKEKIQIFSAVPERSNQIFFNYVIQPLESLNSPDILITATNKSQLIDILFLNNHEINSQTLLIDLGMPRNCHQEISEFGSWKLANIEQLVNFQENRDKVPTIIKMKQVVQQEIASIVNNYNKQLKTKTIVKLRTELQEVAMRNIPTFISDHQVKEFERFVNTLIHTSQKHLENVILDKWSS